jgi:uncharacterized protein (TIGR00299 family) protein
MRAVYVDPVGGAAGDMILAALIDAGAPAEEVVAALNTLPWPRDSFALDVRRVVAGGLHATQLRVVAHGHGGRTLGDLLALLGAGRLPGRAAARAAAVFERLAAAEAKVHAEPVAEVHFHEVGAIDAVVDIAGTAVALELLGVETLRFGRLAPGQGVVATAHGPLPIPAPATLELLTGVPIELGGPPGEWVTPTGAAILVALGAYAPTGATMAVERIGIGAGQRTRSDRPNVVRVLVGEWSEPAPVVGANGAGLVRHETVVVLESALDDLPAAALAFAVEELRRAGALDVHLTPITMKKGRLGTLVTVLASEDDRARRAHAARGAPSARAHLDRCRDPVRPGAHEGDRAARIGSAILDRARCHSGSRRCRPGRRPAWSLLQRCRGGGQGRVGSACQLRIRFRIRPFRARQSSGVRRLIWRSPSRKSPRAISRSASTRAPR